MLDRAPSADPPADRAILSGRSARPIDRPPAKITARSTAFPQPAPGSAPSPGPIKDVPPGKLHSMLGVTQVSHVQGQSSLAVIDTPLGA